LTIGPIPATAFFDRFSMKLLLPLISVVATGLLVALGSQILDDFLLLAIDPAGKDYNEQLPRLKNEFHRRLGQAKPRRSF
jgi:hypothetical protein